MTEIILLGTGGGRHSTMFQARSTGGLLVITDKARIHLDPGPGALVNMCGIRYDLRTTDAVFVSHGHPDHYSDAAVVVEGMTFGGWRKRGALYGSRTVLDGSDGIGPCLSPYHIGLPTESRVISPGDRITVGDITVDITRSVHNDPTAVGYRITTPDGSFGYVTDTEYFDDIADQYKGCKLIFLPITTPYDRRIKGHMCTDDAVPFIKRVKPEMAVFVHLGIVMLKHDPVAQAEGVQGETGVKTLLGEDLTSIDLADLSIRKLESKRPDWNDIWDLEES